LNEKEDDDDDDYDEDDDELLGEDGVDGEGNGEPVSLQGCPLEFSCE